MVRRSSFGVSATALNATYARPWQASTAYALGQYVISPSGEVVTPLAAFTSGSTFDRTLWKAAPGPVETRNTSLVALGDSITAGAVNGSDPADGLQFDVFQNYALLAAGGQVTYNYNAGVGGNTPAQMLARIETDVIARQPGYCTIMAGTNYLGGVTDRTPNLASDVTAICDRLRNAGIKPILITIPPQGSYGQTVDATLLLTHTRINKFNLWIRRYARSQGIPLVDAYALLVDTTTGNYASGMHSTLDGTTAIHPSPLGEKTIGNALGALLKKIAPASDGPYITADNGDPINLIPNPLAITDANADGFPDSWWSSGVAAGLAVSLGTDSAVLGKVFTQTRTSSAIGTSEVYRVTVAGGKIAVGDKLAFSCWMKADTGNGAGMSAAVGIRCSDGAGTPSRGWVKVGQDVGWSRVYTELTVRPSCTTVRCEIQTTGGNGSVSIAQPTMLNLTALGIAAL